MTGSAIVILPAQLLLPSLALLRQPGRAPEAMAGCYAWLDDFPIIGVGLHARTGAAGGKNAQVSAQTVHRSWPRRECRRALNACRT